MGQRGPTCTLCAGDSQLLVAVNSRLETGERLTSIAADLNLSKHVLQRHRKHALLVPVVVSDDSARDEMRISDERLHRWLTRSEEMFQASVGQSDLRMALESVRSGLRAEIEWRRRQEARMQTPPSAGAGSGIGPNGFYTLAGYLSAVTEGRISKDDPQGRREASIEDYDELVRTTTTEREADENSTRNPN